MALEKQTAEPTPAAESSADDDFSAAFASFAQPEPASADPVPVDPAPVATDPAPVDPAPVDPAPVDPAPVDPAAVDPAPVDPAPVDPAPAATDPAPVDPTPTPPPSADDILSRLDQIVSKTTAPEPKPVVPAAEDAPAPLYSEEEQQFLTGYEKDWSDVTKGEALRRRAENAQLVQFIFSEVGKVLNPLRETTEALATRTHYTDIEQKIGQYDDSLRDQVEQWIGSQPDYLQTAYNEVINRGTSEQVVDLVARFRKETGQAPQPVETKGNELSDPTKKAVASLAPVETKRTVIEQKDDPNDFDGAFGRFAEALRPK